MSQENVEILRRMYEVASRGDWDSVFREYLHPDCEARFEAGPQAGTHRGHEAILSAISDVTAGFDAWILEVVDVTDAEALEQLGDRATAAGSSLEDFATDLEGLDELDA